MISLTKNSKEALNNWDFFVWAGRGTLPDVPGAKSENALVSGFCEDTSNAAIAEKDNYSEVP